MLCINRFCVGQTWGLRDFGKQERETVLCRSQHRADKRQEEMVIHTISMRPKTNPEPPWGYNPSVYVCVCVCVCVRIHVCLVSQLCLTLCNPMDCSQPGSSICRDSQGNNTSLGCHALLQGIFPTQGSNPDLPHSRQILYGLSHQGNPRMLEWVSYPFSRGFSWPRNWTRVSCIADRFFNSWASDYQLPKRPTKIV